MKHYHSRRFWALLLTLILALSLPLPALAADGDGDDTTQTDPTGPISNLRFTGGDGFQGGALNISYGSDKPGTLTASFDRNPGMFEDLVFIWNVSPASLVEMDHSSETISRTEGYTKVTNSFRPLDVGTGTVTVTCNGDLYAECPIVVSPDSVDVNGISVSSDGTTFSRNITLFLGEGETARLSVRISPDNASNKNVIWESNNEAVVSVDDQGRLTAHSIGIATITVKSQRNNTITATCQVTVHGGGTLTLNRSELSMSINSTSTLTGILTNYDGNRITWTSSDPDIVSVASTSISGSPVTLTAHKEGTVTITAVPMNFVDPPEALVAKCEITVTADSVREVHITCPNTGYMSIGGSPWRLTAEVIPSTAPQNVTWTSSDAAVATVSADGRVTAIGPGKTTIVATSAGGVKDEYTVEVSGILFPTAKTVFVDKSLSLITELQRFGDAQIASPVTWTSSNPSIAPVTTGGAVTGRYPGVSNVTVKVGTAYTAVCAVTVEEDIAQAVTATVDAGDMLNFSSFRTTLNDRCKTKTGYDLSFMTNITVSTDQGIVYYNYISPDSPNHGVGASERYYYTAPAGLRDAALINDLCYIAKGGFSGESIISYTGYNTQNDPYNGKIIVTVKGTGDVTYLTAANQPLAFRSDDFANMCILKTGRSIRYVTFSQPSASSGTLYYQYSSTGQYSQKVTSGTKYYASSNPSIDTLTFVPAENFSGKVTIPYTCTDSAGASYSGNVTVNVYSPEGSSTGGVTYNIAPNQRVTMVPADFNAVSRNKNGSTLNYILFDKLPASNEGVLYYDYTSSNSERAATSTRYYRSASTSQFRLDRVSFVPASGFTGSVSIPFTGYDNAGGKFTDTLTIKVSENSGAVTYSTSINRPVSFNAADFNEACQKAMNEGLDHVRFSLPSTREGILYYNYSSSRSNNTRVSASSSYYRSGSSNAISNITFVPASNFTGVVTFGYTGYSSGDGSYSGTVQITVGGGTAISSGITYTGGSLPISLRTTDFQNACAANTGGTLSYIQFNSLPTSAGTLYSGYYSVSQPGTAAVAGASYSANSYPYISQLTFVPKAEYQGQATMRYTGYDTQGRSFTGTVLISLSNAYCSTPFTDMTNNWAKSSVEYLRQAGVVNGYSNNTVFGPSDNVTRGQFTLMICRAFGFPTTGGGSSFSDVPANSVFAGAIASAQSMGIVQGTGNGRFQPNSPITRQSAMTMIVRAMEAAGRYVPTVSVSTLASYGDGNRVSEHARSAVASLVYLGVVRGNTSNNLNPGTAISRAEMAVILHRVLTL